MGGARKTTAGELSIADIGKEIRVPLSNGASVQDELMGVFHSRRDVPVDDKTFDMVEKPFSLIRFKNVRPSANPWDLRLSHEFAYLRECFEVAVGTEVVVEE